MLIFDRFIILCNFMIRGQFMLFFIQFMEFLVILKNFDNLFIFVQLIIFLTNLWYIRQLME